jgi:hypothetical protein
MDITTIKDLSQLGGTIVTVLLFLNYLTKRDNKWTDSLKANSNSNVVLAKALQKLTDKVEINITSLSKNSPILEKNTKAVSGLKDVIKNGNGKH